MLTQLDPGFTIEGFLVNFAIQASAALFAVVGALFVAKYTIERTIRHDQATRRQEDEKRRKEDIDRRNELGDIESKARIRLLEAVLAEIKLNIRALDFMFDYPAVKFPLRLDALGLYLPHLVLLPDSVAERIQEAVMHVDRYNALDRSDSGMALSVNPETRAVLRQAGLAIADYLQPDRAPDDQPRTFWKLVYRDGLEERTSTWIDNAMTDEAPPMPEKPN